ncbi:MAG: dihydroorotate dehydrogenase-like protein [Porphyromonadaceae bacterium]|nr:dihydroorotate dehydrogenase-like protein [Porphyromonadaceae bacterium]
MADISTSFVGLHLQSPIIIGSSGLTRNLDKVKAFAEAGAGAVILKSLFEEQIEAEAQSMEQYNDYTEASEYIAHYVRAEEVGRYLEQISRYKRELNIPVIASINCLRADSWVDFATRIQEAGADALEVNIMRLETDLYFDPMASEQSYCDIVSSLRSRLSIPIIVKLSRYHTALPALVDKLRASGANAVTLFNRSYQSDIDLNTEELRSGDVFTHVGDFTDTLRFTALVSSLVPQVEISASTGIYTWQEVTKSMLAGAGSVQMCTALYKEGPSAISNALVALGMWMDKRGYRSIEEFRARLNGATPEDVNVFERIQFMKYFGGRGDS